MKRYSFKQEKNHETYQSDEKDENFDKKLTNTNKNKGFLQTGSENPRTWVFNLERLCKREREIKRGERVCLRIVLVWLYYEDKEEERVKVGMMSLGFDSQRQAQILMKGGVIIFFSLVTPF